MKYLQCTTKRCTQLADNPIVSTDHKDKSEPFKSPAHFPCASERRTLLELEEEEVRSGANEMQRTFLHHFFKEPMIGFSSVALWTTFKEVSR